MVEGQKDGNVRSQLYGATRRPGNYRTTGVRSEKAEHFFFWCSGASLNVAHQKHNIFRF